MDARIKRFATRIAVIVGVSGFLALVAAILKASRDHFWERRFLDNFVLYWGLWLAALPWLHVVEYSSRRSWRDGIPVPLGVATGGLAFCIIFDLQRGRPWNQSISELPEPMYWLVIVSATVSVLLLIREHTRSDRIGPSRERDDVA
jgi:hypothetical protein